VADTAAVPTYVVERRDVLAPEHLEELYALYEAAFGGLRTRAAAKHVLSREEFDEEMSDPRIDKYVAVAEDGQILGLSTFTGDLVAVPWISPEYYAHHYPEHTARRAVYYLGLTMVRPQWQRGGVFEEMVATIVRRLRAESAVCAWDMCRFNVEVTGLNDAIAGMLNASGGADIATIDTQTYVAALF